MYHTPVDCHNTVVFAHEIWSESETLSTCQRLETFCLIKVEETKKMKYMQTHLAFHHNAIVVHLRKCNIEVNYNAAIIH